MMKVLGFDETFDHFVKAISLLCYGHVCMEDGNILRWLLDFEVQGHSRNDRPIRVWESRWSKSAGCLS